MKKTYLVTDYGVQENCTALQTEALQQVFDLCKEEGGTVVIPKGRFYTGGLRMWSDTTLYLKEGAELYGSDEREDYPVFEVPEGIELRSDMELIAKYYKEIHNQDPWETYRRAIISVYGGKNVSIIGEKDSIIDGADCYDPDGEEGYRGPHGMYITCCDNLHLEGYTIQNTGNFQHEVNNCTNVTMRHVTCLAGSDGIHAHCCTDVLIEECLFKTGDDCIAGINVRNLHVKNCIINTACNMTRMGGVNVLFENCYVFGPGYYPHRMTVVKGKNDCLPREMGRHNLICVLDYFASDAFPYEASDITLRNCLIENPEQLLNYHADGNVLQLGTHLAKLTLENVRITGLNKTSYADGAPEEPLTVRLKKVSVSFRENAEDPNGLIADSSTYTAVVEE